MLERDLQNGIDHEAQERYLRMRGISRGAWQTSPSFTRYTPEKQDKAVEALTTLGLAVHAKCHKKWNSQRWAEVLEDLNEENPEIVSQVLSVTSETAGTNAFRNLFQMLEVVASTMHELREKKKLHSQTQVGVRAKVSHTIQTPASRSSYDPR